MGGRSRRFFMADFLFVIVLVAAAMVFFWPKLFQTSERRVLESDVREAFLLLSELEENWLEVSRESLPDLNSIPAFLETRSDETARDRKNEERYAAKAFLLDSNGTIYGGENESVIPFNEIANGIRDRKRDAFVYSRKGAGFFVLLAPLPRSDYRLIVIKPYPPLFQTQSSVSNPE